LSRFGKWRLSPFSRTSPFGRDVDMEFDPYHRWLGILPKDQPPNHYRLLAIDPTESDPEAIRDAAEARMAHVRTYQLKYPEHSQKILNELAAAKACLLDPKAKAAYDRQLSSQGGKSGAASPVSPLIPPPPATQHKDAPEPVATPDVLPPEPPPGTDSGFTDFIKDIGKVRSPTPQRNRKPLLSSQFRKRPWLVIPLGGAAAIVLVGILLSMRSGSGTGKSDVSDPKAKTRAKHDDASSKVKKSGSSDDHAPPLAIAPFDEKKAKEHQEAWAKYLGVSVVETNSIGMKLALIPPGEFMMGSPDDQGGSCEHPRHRVRISRPFYISKHDVTLAQLRLLVEKTGLKTLAEQNFDKDNWRTAAATQTENHPATFMTWVDAVEFCRCLSSKEGATYRLPTEAEWEYACRAGTTTGFYFGDDEKLANDYVWSVENSRGQVQPVGRKRPNVWGLFDMLGNVWEWCSDWFGDSYPELPVVDPTGVTSGNRRVVRGGYIGPERPTSAHRGWWDGLHRDSITSFRVVCEIHSRDREPTTATSRSAETLSGIAPSNASGADNNAGVSPEEAKQGFVSLFDGKTLNGWQGATGDFFVENGSLVCKGDRQGSLLTWGQYSDFSLRFEFKLSSGANNGVVVRGSLGNKSHFENMEIQILDNSFPTHATLPPSALHGAIDGVRAAEQGHLKPLGEWNRQEILCVGRHLSVNLNGAAILDADLDEVARSPADCKPHPGLARDSGYIGFHAWCARVEFRNIRVKKMSSTRPASTQTVAATPATPSPATRSPAEIEARRQEFLDKYLKPLKEGRQDNVSVWGYGAQYPPERRAVLAFSPAVMKNMTERYYADFECKRLLDADQIKTGQTPHFKAYFDFQKHLRQIESYGKDRALCEDPSLGCAVVRYWYNTRGLVVQEAFFDTAGRPCENNRLEVVACHAYDGEGTRVETRFFDGKGSPAEDRLGVHRRCYLKDGQQLEYRLDRSHRELWLPGVSLGKRINADGAGMSCLSPSDKELYFEREKETFCSVWRADHWSDPQPVMAGNRPLLGARHTISSDGSLVAFSSWKDRYPDLPNYGGGNVYFTERKNGQWQTVRNAGPKINSNRDVSGQAFVPGKHTLCFAARGQLFLADRDGELWGEPRPFGLSPAGDPKFAPGGNRVYFISNRKGSFGGDDLWMAERRGADWSRPVNLGLDVNGADDETNPYPALSGTVMYFQQGPRSHPFAIYVTARADNGAAIRYVAGIYAHAE
jgi:formylglycine-generating enzyme required for sulfatase activity